MTQVQPIQPAPEPTVALDELAGTYLVLRERMEEAARLEKEINRLKKKIREHLGGAHVGTIYGEPVLTYRPTNTFRRADFVREQGPLAQLYTRPVMKEELDVDAIAAEHPAIWEQYRARSLRFMDT